ncbi:MAG: FG-GAP-like repeat-containing protein [Bryobacteraceae bacterium]|nr:FG-GAP-like repeat-containing protein [Bryobacteraceae bacterium]
MTRRHLLLGAMAQAQKPGKWFTDVTEHVFGALPAFQNQLSKGIPYWRARLDVMCGTDVYGSQGIAVGDIDNDGRDEIYVCQSGGLPNRLFRIGAGGVAVDLTEKAGVGILDDTSSALFLDTRNRGVQDLIVLRSNGPLLFLNDGSGVYTLDAGAFRFATPPQGSFTGMAAADYDCDGYVDLYLCSYIYYQSEDQYRYPSPYHDARNGPPNFLFRNQGGQFADVTRESGMDENNNRYSFAAAWCDSDGDGRPELYVANDFGRNNYYKWDGGRFRDVAAAAGVEDIGPGMSAAWFDFDGDGRFDLYVANMYTEAGQRIVKEKQLEPAEAYQRHAKGNSLYRNLGAGKFEETRQAEMGRWAWCADGYDFDLDGRPELYVAAGMITGDRTRDLHEFFWDKVVSQKGRAYEEGWNTINQLIREGDSWCGHEANVFYAWERGKFVDRSAESGADFSDDSRAFAFVDVDGDGITDLVLKSRLGPQVRVLRNERGAGRPVVGLRLRGTKSNRDAIGAVVRVGKQVQQVSAGSGYLSQHTKSLYFPAAAQGEIRWPSGHVEKLAGLSPGHMHTVEEGKGVFNRTPFAPREAMRSAEMKIDNAPASVSFRLLDPLPYPAAVRGERERAVLGRFLRDWRMPLPASAQFHLNERGDLTDVSIGGPRADSALPFGGRYVTLPQRSFLKLGAAFYMESLPDAALVYWNDALQRQPNAEAANGLGLMFARQGRRAEARDWFERAIAIDGKHAGARNNLGVLFGEQREWAKAIATFEAGIQEIGADETLFLNLARIHIQSGDRQKARQVMERLLLAKPDSRVARRALTELQ